MASLDLGVIGNCCFSALIDPEARIVWACLPRFDGDPVFCELLQDGSGRDDGSHGVYAVELEDYARSEQEYLRNTAILVTRLYDRHGGAVEITDFAPRFNNFGRIYRPTMIVRMIKRLAGAPRIRIVIRPRFHYGTTKPQLTTGSNHIRYVGPEFTMRLTTTAPLSYVQDERPFLVDGEVSLILGPDESFGRPLDEAAREFHERTKSYWQEWVRNLAVPLEWQDAVVRATLTLKLCSFEETGAIVAALTTSIPESPDSGRNWDYRFCWLRDAFFVVRALNRLGNIVFMENFQQYVQNIVANSEDGNLQPVYGIALETNLTERQATGLPGYRGMGPVRIGNQAYVQQQNDVYGNIVMAAVQGFFDQRLLRPASMADFEHLERLGERAFKLHDQPDAGMWELRTRASVHTSSALMCWAACDRLGKAADRLGLTARAAHWRERAQLIHRTIMTRAWNAELDSFTDTYGGDGIDASLLLMVEVGFIKPDDRKFLGTLKAVETHLRRGDFVMRYSLADDFGVPEVAFNICTFWYIEALAAVGREDEARALFERMLACRNHLGLLSEDTDLASGELWGNFPQTYSMLGIINAAMRLSADWETVT